MWEPVSITQTIFKNQAYLCKNILLNRAIDCDWSLKPATISPKSELCIQVMRI